MTDRPRTVARLALPLAVAAFLAPALSSQAPAPHGPPPVINQSTDPLLRQLPVPIDRSGQHGRPHRRHRGLGERPEHHLSRLRGRRRVQVREQRHDVRAGVRHLRHGVDRRHRHPSDAIPNIVYVGTGEPNNRQTSSFGDGIYKTTDGGKTFTNIGLKETQTIARIVIDPKNPETVYVASPGHLFGPNPERGIYKTTDGGKTWNKVKFIDDDTGLHRHRDRSVEHQHPLRGELPAPPQRLLLQRRRAGQRASGRPPTPARRGRS